LAVRLKVLVGPVGVVVWLVTGQVELVVVRLGQVLVRLGLGQVVVRLGLGQVVVRLGLVGPVQSRL
jgi:hypothetical protein